MTIQQTAERLKDLLSKGQFEAAQKEFFHDDAVSIEPLHSGLPQVKGISAILEKGKQFRDNVEQFHSLKVSEPVISVNHFALALRVELTFKGQEKSIMDELIVYTVKDDKIIREDFFY